MISQTHFWKHWESIESVSQSGVNHRVVPMIDLHSEICSTAVTGLVGVNKIGSVGIPLIHNNMMIYDNDHGTELPYYEIGEICIQSPSRMIGYMNNEQATRDLFRVHEDGSEWLHTGDLGYIDEDGFLFIEGRMKMLILTVKGGVTYKVFSKYDRESA